MNRGAVRPSAAALAFVAIVAGGCTGSTDSPSEGASVTSESVVPATTVVVVEDAPTAGGADTVSSTPAVSGLQEEILSDGVVTEEEMFAAMQATVACIERQGFTASLSEMSPGMWSVTTSARDSAEMSRANEATDACMAEYSDAVQLRYSVGRLPPETDVGVIWECLLDRGVLDGSEPDPTIAFQMAEAVDASVTWECIRLGRDG